MTENDAPESTRARIGFLSIITSSWLPVILAVDGGFPVHAAFKVALLSFPRSYGLATDWIGDMATGICNDVLGSASRGTWRKTARRVWSAYFFFSANVVEVPSAVSRVVKDSLSSLGSSALHVQDVRSGNKQDWGSESKDSCVWLTSRWTTSRTIVRIRETKSVSSVRMQPVRRLEAFQISVDQLFCFISSI
ncbi:hypothetical protein TNCV_976261 [Trichonephila clavipes]|nr:hypothetical protein TNCV_976261 [Trichonephila clavipes]